MVIHLSKAKLAVFSVMIAAVVCMCFLGGSFLKKDVLARFPVCEKTIVIDAGHGGIDGGAVAKDGSVEKDINLSIAKYLESYLIQSGAKVIMTRTQDMSLHSRDAQTVNEKKKSDLLKRKEKVTSSGADLFVSIHQNFFTESKYRGAQTFYEPKSPHSKTAALIIQNSLKDNADNSNLRLPMQINSSKMLFNDLKLPSVLIECGFLSNPEEAKMLSKKEYQQKLAFSIYLGIIQYFDKEAR
ncbi:MAG: N-acetylmuramoyl-L-alanine amidase CwlD [Clostridia bacterium]|nr:N-acetylmuramoyl-L-alanine amidase CwlD [Clostridia bacterium]